MLSRLLSCLSARDKGPGDKSKGKSATGSRTQDRTLGGRVQKKGKEKPRPIPKGFLDRFLEEYANFGPQGRRVGKGVIDYYTKELTNRDYDFEFSKARFSEEFGRQLGIIKDKRLNVDESDLEISPDKQWRVFGTLNSGSYGTVYYLEWHPFGTMNPIQFALKDTHLDHFWGDYCAEGELTRRLNMIGCPNVVKVHDWVKTRDPVRFMHTPMEERYRFRILYDYYDHGDLNDLIKFYIDNDLLLPESFVWHVIHQIATALIYCAHGQPTKKREPDWEEIVHKDVKPANILIGPNPQDDEVYPKLFLADFGLAYTIPNEDIRAYKKAFHQGTENYVAPEAQDSMEAASIGPASDIFSLGKVVDACVDGCCDKIYNADEMRLVCQQPDMDQYIPYTNLLWRLKDRCSQPVPGERPGIYSLWKLARNKAAFWKQVVWEKRRQAFAQGKEFYYGMVLFDKHMRLRIFNNRQAREEFERATKWEFRNRNRIEQIRNEVKRRQAALRPGIFDPNAFRCFS